MKIKLLKSVISFLGSHWVIPAVPLLLTYGLNKNGYEYAALFMLIVSMVLAMWAHHIDAINGK